jgi:hypothetical protein
MTYQGHFENGVVVLDEVANIANGAKVHVHVLNAGPEAEDVLPNDPKGKETLLSDAEVAKGRPADATAQSNRTLAERLKNVIGQGKGLPSDLAKNHDHYIHGAPKK